MFLNFRLLLHSECTEACILLFLYYYYCTSNAYFSFEKEKKPDIFMQSLEQLVVFKITGIKMYNQMVNYRHLIIS